MEQLQLARPKEERLLHTIHGHDGIKGIYGAGCTRSPEIMLVFMNPTARNIASNPSWKGLRAPWIGVSKIWRMLSRLGLIDEKEIPSVWSEAAAHKLYAHVASRKLYITNLATCTQPDARHLSDSVFKKYLPLVYKEIAEIKPKKIITMGNQVSSVILQKPVSVSAYKNVELEYLILDGNKIAVYPTYYPVGQGQRNMPKAIRRIRAVAAA